MFRARQLLVVTVLCLLLTTGEGAAKAAPLPYQDGMVSAVELFRAAQQGVLHMPEYQSRIESAVRTVGGALSAFIQTVNNDAFRATVLSVFVDNPRWSNKLQVNTLRATNITESEALLRGVVTNVPVAVINDTTSVLVRAFDFDSGARRPLRLLVASSSSAFEVQVTGLSCNTRYSYRALLAYKDGLTKGYNQYFTTAPCQ
jgi:hypothetical protein